MDSLALLRVALPVGCGVSFFWAGIPNLMLGAGPVGCGARGLGARGGGRVEPLKPWGAWNVGAGRFG
jgi:hypothetical protein